MRIWVDDVRPAPEGYIWVKSVMEAKKVIEDYLEGSMNDFQNLIKGEL